MQNGGVKLSIAVAVVWAAVILGALMLILLWLSMQPRTPQFL